MLGLAAAAGVASFFSPFSFSLLRFLKTRRGQRIPNDVRGKPISPRHWEAILGIAAG